MLVKAEIQKKALLKALVKTRAIVTEACKIAKVSRSTYYRHYREDEEFRKEVDELQNLCLDFAESKLFKGIENDNMTAIIFYLKTKGKKRGYIERTEQEISVNQTQPLFPDIDYNTSEEE